jgi:hypothetical protein
MLWSVRLLIALAGLLLSCDLSAAEPLSNQVNSETKNYWAFRPVHADVPPGAGDPDWQKSPIDRFVSQRLADAGLRPNEAASRREWLRRATYDLLGLSPTLEEVQAFESDESPEAFERAVDRLLGSQHYGEKWGRHWLDLVRFAESNGYERDGTKPLIWAYRDYVIRSFNDDKPYDRFTVEQLAGDEIDEPTVESIIATGYHRLGLWDDEPVDPELARYDNLDSILSTTSEVFLGLTVGCGRCHDHKIDPIPQADYYRLLAFFANIAPHGRGATQRLMDVDAVLAKTESLPGDLVADSRVAPTEWAYSFEKPAADWTSIAFDDSAWQRGLSPFGGPDVPCRVSTSWTEDEIWLRRKFDVTEKVTRLMLSSVNTNRKAEMWINGERVVDLVNLGYIWRDEPIDQFIALLREGENVVAVRAVGGRAATQLIDVGLTTRDRRKFMTVEEWPWGGTGRQTHVLYRGNPHAPGEVVEPGFPTVLSPPEPKIVKRGRSWGRRRALGEWIVDPKNPLTSRVIVNRIWQYHFGRGIVRSSSNFGGLGEPPTHPRLLDWLAGEFVRGGWKFKAFHKLIMLSQTYRMSSRVQTEALEQDPSNDLFWRFDARRLTAEEVRDSILATSGKLNPKMYGPSFYSVLPADILATSSTGIQKWGTSPVEETYRRSVYLHVRRSLKDPMLTGFDFADTDASCAVRFTTTVPTQALTLLNSAYANEHALFFAERLRHVTKTPAEQVRRGIEIALARPATEVEVQRGLDLLARFRDEHGLEPGVALERYALLLLNLNEFLYLD